MAWFGARARAGVGLCLVVALMSACGGSKPQPNTAASAGSDSSSSKAGPAEIGKAAPDLEIQTLNGKGPLKLDSLAGQIVVVDFWAMWCGPCKQSMPKLEEIAKQNVGKVQVIGISVDDKQDGVADFAKSAGVTFPIAWDDGHTIANRWKVDSMPTTYILDGTGTVRHIHAGYHPGEADAIAKEISALSTGTSTTEVAASTAGGGTAAASTTTAAATATPAAAEETAKDPEPAPPVTKPKKGGKPGKGKPAAKGAAKPKKK